MPLPEASWIALLSVPRFEFESVSRNINKPWNCTHQWYWVCSAHQPQPVWSAPWLGGRVDAWRLAWDAAFPGTTTARPCYHSDVSRSPPASPVINSTFNIKDMLYVFIFFSCCETINWSYKVDFFDSDMGLIFHFFLKILFSHKWR